MLEVVAATIAGCAILFTAAGIPRFVRSVGLYGRRDSFSCSLCGNCCRFQIISLTDEDIRRLEDAGYSGFYEGGREKRMKRDNGRCVFLKEDRCRVHERRPTVCRQFPFFRIYGIGYAAKASFCPALKVLEDER